MTPFRKTNLELPGLIVAVCLGVTLGPNLKAASIVWDTPTYLAADTDATTVGSLAYAYNWTNATRVLNGVSFTGTNSTTTVGTDLTLAGFTGNTTNAYNYTSASAFFSLSAAYRAMVIGGDYTAGATTATVTLNNLTAGHSYLSQVWVGDPRSGSTTTRTETLNGGANTVTLDYNSTNAAGGVGQYSIGRFNANATTQAFSLLGNASSQINALQLRDVTNIGTWTGTSGAAWDANSTANFATNLYSDALASATFDTAKTALGYVSFGDSYWNSGSTTTVTQNTVTVAAGGVTAGNVYFENNSVNYTLGSADATGLAGASTLHKTGSGILTLSGTHTYTGGTGVYGGTLRLGSSTALPTTGTLSLTNSAVLDLNGFNASTTLSAPSTATLTDNSAGTGVSTLSLGSAGSIGFNILDGASRQVALRVTNSNGGFLLTNASNNFSGGIVLTNSASGTRMSPGTITAGAYGTGPITVGESATDKAGIFFASANQTLTNPVIANTGEGTDRVGTFRIAATGITFAGQLTANLAPVTFSTNETGSALVTGKITGSNGLTLRSHTLGGTTLTVTLNNAANDYAGDTVINLNPQVGKTYTLALGAADQIPNGSGKGNVTVNTNGTGVGTLQLAGFSETINGLSGNGTVTSSAGTPTLTVGDNNASSTFSGAFTGSLDVVKTGAGTLTLSGASSHSGTVIISSGTVVAQNNAAFGAATAGTTVSPGATLDVGGTLGLNSLSLGNEVFTVSGTGVGGNGAIVNNGSNDQYNALGQVVLAGDTTVGGTRRWDIRSGTPTLDMGGFTLTKTGSNQVSLVGVTISNPGHIVVSAGSFGIETTSNAGGSSANSITIASGATFLGYDNTSPLAWSVNFGGGSTLSQPNGGRTLAGPISLGSGVVTASIAGSTTVFSGSVSGAGSLLKTGAGSLVLSQTNSYTGGTAITAGTLGFASGSLGTTGAITFTGSSTLRWETGNTQDISSRLAAIGSGITATLDTNGNDVALASVLSGSGSLAKNGAGNLTLSADNTYSGGTTLNAGTATAGHVNGFGTGTITLASGATLNLNSLALPNSITNNGGTIVGASGSATISQNGGTLSGNLGGIITASGTVAGNPTINGTLQGTATFTGVVTVASGGFLKGTTNASGGLVIESGGTLSPGNSPGTTSAGNTVWNGGGNYDWELNSVAVNPGANQDFLSITGTLTLNATSGDKFNLKVTSLTALNAAGAVPDFANAQPGYTWTIVTASGGITGFDADAINIDLTNFVNPSVLADWQVQNIGNDINLVYVPEPSTYAALAGLSVLGLAWNRRRQSRRAQAKT